MVIRSRPHIQHGSVTGHFHQSLQHSQVGTQIFPSYHRKQGQHSRNHIPTREAFSKPDFIPTDAMYQTLYAVDLFVRKSACVNTRRECTGPTPDTARALLPANASGRQLLRPYSATRRHDRCSGRLYGAPPTSSSPLERSASNQCPRSTPPCG